MSDHLMIPPQSLEAEQSVLGSLLLDYTCWKRVSEILEASHFYRQDHRLIFNTIAQISDKSFDLLLVSDYMETKGTLSRAGGLAYLGELMRGTPSSANVMSYAKVVKERYLLREVILAGRNAASTAYVPEGKTSADILETLQLRVAELNKQSTSTEVDVKSVTAVLQSTFASIKSASQSDKPFVGLSTGFSELDSVTLGLERGDLIILGARPSMGKTSLAMNILENVTIDQSLPGMIFSMEMTDDQLMKRMISSRGRVPLSLIRTGKLFKQHWDSISMAMGSINKAPLNIVDKPGLTLRELSAYARRVHEETPLSIIVVDYLQLMTANGHDSRNYEIEEISRGLKNLAKELDLPIVALCQLSRAIEKRNDKRPLMSDLRDSGSIEQDADTIMFLYRDDVYDPNSTKKGIADVIFAKCRNGEPKDVQLSFLGQYVRFQDLPAFGSGYEGFDD